MSAYEEDEPTALILRSTVIVSPKVAWRKPSKFLYGLLHTAGRGGGGQKGQWGQWGWVGVDRAVQKGVAAE